MICCLGDIRIQFKKNKEGRNLKNSVTKSLAQEFWVNWRSLLPFQTLNSFAGDSLLMAQIFVTWPVWKL